jgi:hypothetical protein
MGNRNNVISPISMTIMRHSSKPDGIQKAMSDIQYPSETLDSFITKHKRLVIVDYNQYRIPI